MTANPETEAETLAQPASVSVRLAKSLVSQRDEIIAEMLHRVGKDSTIPTDFLTVEQARDHLPELFDDLVGTLSRYGSAAVEVKSERDGERHGAARWEQGFRLPEMLREIMHLRAILIERLGLFEAENEDFGIVSRLFVTSTLHGFLDEMGINATEQYLNQGLQAREGLGGGDSPHGFRPEAP